MSPVQSVLPPARAVWTHLKWNSMRVRSAVFVMPKVLYQLRALVSGNRDIPVSCLCVKLACYLTWIIASRPIQLLISQHHYSCLFITSRCERRTTNAELQPLYTEPLFRLAASVCHCKLMGRVTTLGRSSSRTIYCSENITLPAATERGGPQTKPGSRVSYAARGCSDSGAFPPPGRRVPVPSRLPTRLWSAQ